MLPELMRVLGVDLNLKFAEIRAQAEDFRATTHPRGSRTSQRNELVAGFAVTGAIAALATLDADHKGAGEGPKRVLAGNALEFGREGLELIGRR
jgi:hypothetical protein